MRPVRFSLPRIRVGLAAAVSAVIVVTGAPLPVQAQAPAPGRPQTAAAVQGPGSPERPLPASALPNKGLPAGQRPPVEPPATKPAGGQEKLTAQRWAKVDKPVKGAKQGKIRAGNAASARTAAAEDAGRGADALVLRSGYATGDTSLVVYFKLADTAITSWSATVYDAASQEAQQSVTLGKGDLPACGSPRPYCRGFGGAEGWALDAGRDYFVQITVTYPDGTTVTSASSNNARPRTLGKSPAIPAAQASGCACANALGRTASGQQLRGLGVNTGTGAYTRVENDLGMASFAVPFNLVRVYSSSNTSSGVFGNGWASTLDLRVTSTDSGATVRAEDGAQADFKRNDDGSYQRPAGVRSNLKKTDAGWELTTPEQITYRFDGGGRLLSAKNKRGYGTTLTYKGALIDFVTDAAGRKVTFEHRADLGFVSKVTLPDGRDTRYDYQGGRLHSFTSAIKQTWQYTYDQGGRLHRVVNARGLADVTNVYNATTGRVEKQTDILGKDIKVEWDAGKEEAKVTDQDGVVNYDGYTGNLLKYTQNGNGDSTSHRYDAQANPTLNVDGNNNQREATFDGAGNMATHKAPEPFSFTERAEFTKGNKPEKFVDGRGVEWTAEYNDFHEMTKRTNGEGHSYKYAYDDRGLRTSMTDPKDNVSTYEYHADGHLKAEITPKKRRTEYTYDRTGRLKTVTDPRGFAPGANKADFTTSYEYDEEDRQKEVKQPGKALPWKTVYDEKGRTKTVTDPLSHNTIYDYDEADRLQVVKSPRGDLTEYTYTAAGRLKTQANGKKETTEYKYSNKGVLDKLITARGKQPGVKPDDFTWTFHYDGNNNPVRRTHPNPGGGTVTRDTSWDELDRATTETDPLGDESKTSYDNNDNVTGVEDPAKARMGFEYDKNNRRTDVTNPREGNTKTEYDKAGNPEKVTQAGGVTKFHYNADNQLEWQVEPRGNVDGADAEQYKTHFEYDLAGNQTVTTDPLGNVTRTSYDQINRVTSSTDANKHVTTLTYYDDDKVKTVTGPDAKKGQDTTYQYDANGALTSVRDPLGHTRTFIYDEARRLKATTDDLGRYREHEYDAEGNLTETTIARTVADPRNPGRDPEREKHTIVDTYDSLNRRTQTKLGSVGPVYTFGYNAKDELTSANDPTGEQTYKYFNTGRLKQVTRGDRVFDYDYDLNGNVKYRKFPDSTTVTADYDKDNRIKELTAAGSTWTFDYDAASRRTETKLPAGGLVEKISYDRAGRLEAIDTANDAGTVGKYLLDLDPAGNPKKITTTRGGTTEQVAYKHDPADRLTDACYGAASCDTPAAGKISYTYDLVGNRKTQKRTGSAGSSSTTYEYDVVDQLRSETTTGTGAGTKTYKYDLEGNQIDEGANRYEYHLDRTLLSATVDGQKTTYTYNAGGQRITATTGASTRTWDWDTNGKLPQIAIDRTGDQSRTFIHNATGEPLALREGDANSFYAHDWLGGTSALVSGGGGVQAVYDYDPYGLPRKSPTQSGVELSPTMAAKNNPLRFTGQYQDPTVGGDYFMRQRMYDAGTGTFNSVDPEKPGIGQPAVSPYSYVNGRVLRAIDPSGRSLKSWLNNVTSKGMQVEAEVEETLFEWGKGALDTYAKLDDASATSVGTSSQQKKSAQRDLKEAYKPQNIVNSYRNEINEDSGNPTRQVTRGVMELGGLLLGGRGLAKSGGKGRAGASCAHSFSPDTPVLMAGRHKKTKKIKDVKIGDRVKATDPQTGKTFARTVTALHRNQDTDLIDLTVRTSDGKVRTLYTTSTHPFWNTKSRTWTPAGELSRGDVLHTTERGKTVTVRKVRAYTGQRTMNDLTIDTTHTYYVMAGAAPVLVHNCNGSTNSHLDGLPVHPEINKFNVRASELINNRFETHPLNPHQMNGGDVAGHGGVRNLSNEDLIRPGGPQGNDPIRGARDWAPGDCSCFPASRVYITGGHHRTAEIARRVQARQMDPDTLIEFLISPP